MDKGAMYPLGVTKTAGGMTVLVHAKGESCRLLLFEKGEREPKEILEFEKRDRVGSVWSMTISGRDLSRMEYCFEADGRGFPDPCGREFSGLEVWGDLNRGETVPRARFETEEFDWEGDEPLRIPYHETILYRLHVRGFTKHSSSGVKDGGTFAAVEEKIPYIKKMGVTAVELMPSAEFDEVMRTEPSGPFGKSEPAGTVNYWGYGPSLLFAPKAAYSSRPDSPSAELKGLIKSLHKNGLECILELYFTGNEELELVLNALRHWVQEYHVDGFHLTGFPQTELLGTDPFLSGTKLFAESWEGVLKKRPAQGYPEPAAGPVTVEKKNLAEYNAQFEINMRKLLKGDEDMMNALSFFVRRNPADCGAVNYMANTNGFTMMDMVSYDRKHNEKNGEENRDGDDYNYSWNCGAEGPTRKKKVRELRRRQLRNAFLLLFLSQGTPLLLAGDEFGNSQNGNNNAYCQDNEISWLDWRLLETNRDLYEFVCHAAAFRKAHPVFHMEREPRIMDYRSLGRPDMSYHGENAWKPEYENFRRQLGILYWGPYGKKADGSADDTFYVAYNMHWEPHVFGLPNLPKGQCWHMAFDTSAEEVNGFYGEGEEPVLKNQKETVIPPRSIVVFCGKRDSGFYTYETRLGEITVTCRGGAVTGIHFGRPEKAEKDLEEVRTGLSDQAAEQIAEYLDGTRRTFDLPLHAEGTEFQKRVWEALLTIPYGETRSYKDIAVQIGDGKASRAVGMANNKNPIAIVIPCHRVIGAGGTMTGYGGGLEKKELLLELERAHSGQKEETLETESPSGKNGG